MAKVTKELERLLARAAKKLDAAQDARSDVEDYLEEHYGINAKEEYEKTEDPCTWCFGINGDNVRELIEEKENEK